MTGNLLNQRYALVLLNIVNIQYLYSIITENIREGKYKDGEKLLKFKLLLIWIVFMFLVFSFVSWCEFLEEKEHNAKKARNMKHNKKTDWHKRRSQFAEQDRWISVLYNTDFDIIERQHRI